MSIWVNNLPAGWREAPLKSRLSRNDGGVWGADPTGDGDIVVLRSTEQQVDGGWKIDNPALRQLSAREIDESLLLAGDLVVTKSSGSELHIGKTSLVSPEVARLRACYSNFMQRLRVDNQTDPHFVHYWMNSSICREQFSYLSNTTSGLANLNAGLIGAVLIAFPALEEQERIANFLDEQTARIDALIAGKEKLLLTLQQMRADAIDCTVLGRELPNNGECLSGLSMLGPIPMGWLASRLKYELDYVTSGSRGWADFYADTGALFVRIGNLTRDSLDLDFGDTQRVVLPDAAEGTRARVMPGDLLISITAYLGSVAVAPNDLEEAYVSQHVSLARPNLARSLPRWLGYVVLSSIGRTFFELQAYGGTKIQLSLEDIRELPVPLPEVSVQKERLSYLDGQLTRLAELSSLVVESRNRLQEYRSSLISAAVTGQIDINDFGLKSA
ncbi:restriction endonuclease subunit S [Castellaniella ginsengisoli]|uniref:Restriction endonuclease subunit S n=1 Tax=Castellaniella ginsengisoli TaxID=546114 RepID=A0AB39FKK7_9BURK